MYLDYWQLDRRPFEPIVDGEAFFPSESHRGAMLKLRYGVENRRGAVVLAGPSGTGKTMLVQQLREQLGETVRPFVHLVFPQMTSRDLLAYLADQLGAPLPSSPRYTVEESVGRLETLLARNAEAGRHAVVAIDEAHLLEDCGALETLRLLLNFEPAGTPALTLILVGQAELLTALARFPSLDERVGVKALLRGLSLDETASYVEHRLDTAGATRGIFSPDAIETLHMLTHGIPRRINRLADLALLVGYAEGLPEIGAQAIESVSQELVAVAAD